MGHWPSRPIVGMVKWATTSSSIILSAIGTMFLSLDRTLHPQFAPLVDTLDFVNRLHTFDTNFGFASGDYAITRVDFSNMYSNILWKDVRDALRFWMPERCMVHLRFEATCYVKYRNLWVKHHGWRAAHNSLTLLLYCGPIMAV